jgi:hypothetical protein
MYVLKEFPVHFTYISFNFMCDECIDFSMMCTFFIFLYFFIDISSSNLDEITFLKINNNVNYFVLN